MIAPNAGLSVNRQCTLLGIARSSFYYQPRPVSAEELDLLNRLDRIFTEHPVYGGRRLQVALLREGISVGRRLPCGEFTGRMKPKLMMNCSSRDQSWQVEAATTLLSRTAR